MGAPEFPHLRHRAPSLTERQAQALCLLASGNRGKEIARKMGLSIETVNDHLSAATRVLGAKTRTEAAVKAAMLGVF